MNKLTQSIVVNLLAAVFVVSNQAPATPIRAAAPVITSINKIDKSLADKWVTIKGTVEEASGFSKGFKFVVGDETGKITLTYFDSSYDALPKDAQAKLNVGATVQINGRVSEYNGKFDVIPNKPRDTVIITPTQRSLAVRDLGGLNRGDHGAVVHLKGEFHSEQAFVGGVEWVIFDDSGAQKVRLYDSVLKRIPQRGVVKAGSASKIAVDVVGRVRVSKKDGLRIDVALPIDVVITSNQTVTATVQPQVRSDR
jgi:DNA/RNA endonuclease YhcR with UshA esterase domain